MQRRLIRHGFLLFLASLLLGVAVPTFTSERLALSAHVSGLMSGLFLIALGAVWTQLRLAPRATTLTFWLALYGAWIGTVALILAAFFGTSSMTPIAGAGHAGLAWRETLVNLCLMTSAPAIIASCVLVLLGLRSRAGE